MMIPLDSTFYKTADGLGGCAPMNADLVILIVEHLWHMGQLIMKLR